MMSLRNAEPTLEDIFRLYTGGATQESVNEASNTPPSGPDGLTKSKNTKDVKNTEKKEVTHA
jgi:hypothetical protein